MKKEVTDEQKKTVSFVGNQSPKKLLKGSTWREHLLNIKGWK